MLDVPNPTPYDLRFRVLGFPVRVHPLFWLATLVLGWQAGEWRERLLWVACAFVSILVHELGHALAARATRQRPAIILHMMGGLCVYDPGRQALRERLFVILSGPAAGLGLAALTMVVGRLTFGLGLVDMLTIGGVPGVRPGPGSALRFLEPSPRFNILVFLLYINILWSLINLLPIFPLDGGQFAQNLWSDLDRFRGLRRAHILSAVTAGGLAIYSLVGPSGDTYQALFFAYFAGYNLKILGDIQRGGYVLGPDPADYWKG